MSMDILKTTEPKSDQQNFDDYVGGAKTVTVSEVKRGSSEQPVELHLVEFPGRPFKPGKSMRRVLVAAWGADASEYVGRRLRLYGDPTVRFGGKTVGGIRIAAMSDIPKPIEIPLTITRGRRDPFTVQPLDGLTTADLMAMLNAAQTLDELQSAWETVREAGQSKRPDLMEVKDERKSALTVVDEASPDYIAPAR